MEILAIIIVGVALSVSGVISPKSKDINEIAKAPQTEVTSPVVQEKKPEPDPEPEPEPAK